LQILAKSMLRSRFDPYPSYSTNMNNDNQYLSSFLASRSAAAESDASASSARQAQESSSLADATSSSRFETSVERIASISSGQTVFITVTQDISPTSQVSEVAIPHNTPTRKSNSHVGAIVGGVVGGVAAFALAGLLFRFLWRKLQAKETRRATLPLTYVNADMSEQICGKSYKSTDSSAV
jgi:hypothetical protein